jgi:peptidase E
MAIILGGGGDPEQTPLVDQWFRREILASRPASADILFLAQAVAPDDWSFERATSWLLDREAFEGLQVEVPENLAAIGVSDDYRSMYIMGGNTFRLMDRIRKASVQRVITGAALNALVYGCSAGAVIFGADIRIAFLGAEADVDEVGLSDYSGLNLLNGFNVLPHYEPNDLADVVDFSRETKSGCVCVDESGGALWDAGRLTNLGEQPVLIVGFQGDVKSLSPGETAFIG